VAINFPRSMVVADAIREMSRGATLGLATRRLQMHV
jgi:hypothetical protein